MLLVAPAAPVLLPAAPDAGLLLPALVLLVLETLLLPAALELDEVLVAPAVALCVDVLPAVPELAVDELPAEGAGLRVLVEVLVPVLVELLVPFPPVPVLEPAACAVLPAAVDDEAVDASSLDEHALPISSAYDRQVRRTLFIRISCSLTYSKSAARAHARVEMFSVVAPSHLPRDARMQSVSRARTNGSNLQTIL